MLTEHQVPFKREAQALVILGCCRLEPPYAAEHCVCPNPIVLSRIQTLLSRVELC
jgi:hypothetical protein